MPPPMSDGPPLACWGIEAPLAPLSGGHRNRVLRTLSGPPLVFKSTRRDEAALRWLAPVMRAAVRAGFRVAPLIPARSGRLSEGGWTCEPFLPGRAFAPDEVARIRPRLDRFHALTAGLPQRTGFAAAADLLTRARGGDVDLAAMPPAVARLCRQAWADLAAGPLAAIHGDVGPGNLLWGPEGAITLIDWDVARVDLPFFDTAEGPLAARLAWEVACSWRVEPAQARRTLRQLRALVWRRRSAASGRWPGASAPAPPLA